jgi:hypothetical protein
MTQALPATGVLANFDSDEMLVAAAKETTAEFGSLYERYMPRIYRYLVTRVGGLATTRPISHSSYSSELSIRSASTARTERRS